MGTYIYFSSCWLLFETSLHVTREFFYKIASVKKQHFFAHQFNVDVRDYGVPPKKADRAASVSIRVRRNKQTPSFSNLPATINLEMSTERGTQVFSVDGRDGDEVEPFNELSYSITGDDNAPAFFDIDEEGKITVKGDLTTAPGSEVQYKVYGII